MGRIIKKIIRLITYVFFRAKPMDKSQMKEIWRKTQICCVLTASGIGDALMATSLIEEIKNTKPKIKLIIIASSTTRQVFDTNPKVDMIYSYNPQSLLNLIIMLLKLKFYNIDIFFAVQPSNTIKHSLITAFSGAKARLKHAYDYKSSTERDYSFVYNALLPDSMERHRVELDLDFLRLLGEDIKERSIMPRYYINSNAEKKANELLESVNNSKKDMKIICMHLGGLIKEKKWEPSKFAKIAQTMLNQGYTICLVGVKEDEADSEIVIKTLSNNGVKDFTGKLFLDETAALLKKCQFLLSNDTGIMHLATAVDIPVIAIYGPTDYRHIGPYDSKSKVISKRNNILEVTVSDVINVIRDEIMSLKGIQL